MIRKYEKYKDSGVEWIGEIPETWGVKKLKYFASKVGSGVTPKGGANVYQLNGIPLLRSQNIHFDGLKLDDVAYISQETHDDMENSKVIPGDVFLNITGGSIGRCYFSDNSLGEANVNQHVCIIRPINATSTKYLCYLLRSDVGQKQIDIEQTGSGREGLNFEALKNFLLPVANNSEQAAIASFLDLKTAEIDQLIANKKKLISLYEEEKTVIINRAVTKGLDPKATTKPSGIDWLGDIPKHWKVKRLKYLIISLESGVSVNATDFPAIGDDYGILKTSCVYDYIFNANENKAIWESEISRAKVSPKKGSIIISRMNTPDLVGASGYVDVDYPTLFLPDRLWQTIFFQDVEIDAKWLSYIFKSHGFRKLLSITATGTSPSMKNLGQEEFLNIFVPFMEIDEQADIVAHIETECSRLDTIIDKFKKQIELFKEYRTTLISEVVTGKIDVRGEVAA